MKGRIIILFCFLLVFHLHILSATADDCIVPTQHQSMELLGNSIVYFTYPSQDQLNLELWYTDNKGTHNTNLEFSSASTLSLNSTNSHIVDIAFVNEFYLYDDVIYEGTGSKLSEINIVDTSTMQIGTLPVPDDWKDITFVRRVIWIDDERIMLLSTLEHHIAGIINLSTYEFETLDWLNNLSYPYIPITGGGVMILSPSGDYLYYTLADPFVPSIHWSTTPEFSVLPWTIINLDGEEVLDYKGGVGFFTSWFDEESIITLDTESNDLLRISLDGTFQRLTDNISTLYYRYLVSPNTSKVALTTEIPERDSFHQERPAILNTDTGEIIHYCVDAIRIGKEAWTSDGRLLVYIANNISDGLGGTDIYVLDTINDSQISLLPERIDNDSIGSRFIRVVGIAD